MKLDFNNVQELEPIDASILWSTNVQFSSTIWFKWRSSDFLSEFAVWDNASSNYSKNVSKHELPRVNL